MADSDISDSIIFFQIIWDSLADHRIGPDQALERFLGKDETDFLSLLIEQDQNHYRKQTSCFLASGKRQFIRSPYRLVDSQGSLHWIQETLYARPGESSIEYASHLLEISDTIENSQQLFPAHEHADLLQALADMTPTAVMIYQHDRWVYANAAATEISGYQYEELLDMEFWSFVHPEDLEMVREQGSKRQASRTAISRYSFRIIRKDGHIRWVDLSGTSVPYKGESAGIISIIDITERMNYITQLKESEARFRFLADTTFEAIVTHRDGVVQHANKAFERLSGYTLADVRGQHLFFNIDLDEQSIQIVRENIVKPYAAPYEVSGRRKDGSLFWAEIEGKDTLLNGESIRTVAIRDITEKKLYHSELENRAKLIDALMRHKNTGIMISVLDESRRFGFFEQVNETACALLGYQEKVLLQKDFLELYHPEDIIDRLDELFSRRQMSFRSRLVCSDGSPLPVEVWLYLIFIDGREKVMAFFQDIRETLAVERSYQEKTDLLSGVFNTIHLGIMVWGKEGQIQEINDSFTRITGYTIEDIPTVSAWFSLAYEPCGYDRDHLDSFKKLSMSPEVFVELKVRCADGEDRQIEYRATSLSDGRIILTLLDVTERNRVQESLQTMRSLESIGKLAGGIAHDFNNILSGVLGNISLAQLQIDPEEEISSYLDDALDSIDRASRLANRLLTFSKGGEPVKVPVDIAVLAERIIRMDILNTPVTAVFDLPEKLQPVFADTVQLEQVFSNLTINAVQAMPLGGVIHLSCRSMTVEAAEGQDLSAGEYVCISFRDDGPGIQKDVLHQIFHPYYSTKETGNGLGLSTVYSILDRHGGAIRVHSDFGEGTEFLLYLPMAVGVEAHTVRRAGIQKELLFDKRILVLDDDHSILKTLEHMLGSLGFEVITVTDGESAIEAVKSSVERQQPFDLGIMDLIIPGGMGGQEAVQKAHEFHPELPVLVCSGYADERILSDVSAFGFSGHIPKPFTMELLQEAIDSVQ